MQRQQSYQFGSNNNPLKGLMGVVMAILFFLGLFWFMDFLFTLLWKILPIIIIAVAIIDYKVILDYAGWLGRTFKSNWVTGLIIGLLTFVGAPVVALFLLGKALLKKKVKSIHKEVERQHEGEFVSYEEVENEVLELPQLEEKPVPKKNEHDGYDEMFK